VAVRRDDRQAPVESAQAVLHVPQAAAEPRFGRIEAGAVAHLESQLVRVAAQNSRATIPALPAPTPIEDLSDIDRATLPGGGDEDRELVAM
jgi:hypothetical protein